MVVLVLVLIVDVGFILFSGSGESPNKDSILEDEKIYIGLYVGDIDGHVSENWYLFYERLIEFYEEEKIPAGFSFYSATIEDDEEFNNLIKRMYESPYIELIQKGYRGDDAELNMENLSFEEQKQIIKDGQDHFREKMQEILGKDDINLPTSYNQIGGKFNEDTMKATESLGFKIYYDMFVGDDVVPLESTDTFDIVQYGVSFTRDGQPGKETIFQNPTELLKEINDYQREDLTILTINGDRVIPLWCHHQDFESKTVEEKVDESKWDIYVQTIHKLKEDPRIIFVSPSQIYEMRH